MRFIIVFSLICYYLINNASALPTTCPKTSSTTPSIRLNVTLSTSGMPDYTGTLLSTFDGYFILLLSVDDVDSPFSAIQGTWSCCPNTLTFIGKSFYFLKMSMSTITGFKCTYDYSSSDSSSKLCTATYQTLSNNQIGTATFALDLRAP